jgi:nucleoside-triphosphatase THEP1
MQHRKIYILTGPIQSGKTTALMKWAAGRKDVYGILTPVVHGKRVFRNIHTGEEFEMEAAAEEKNILSVGKFRFSKKSFDRATEIILSGSQTGTGWLVVDEAGPLELDGKGFSETLKNILTSGYNHNIILVVRKQLLEKVIEYFELNPAHIEIVSTDAEIFY